MITELRQHLWMHTPFGEARCIMVIDYSAEDDLYWICIQQDDKHKGQIWTWHNSKVRVMDNVTMLRGGDD